MSYCIIYLPTAERVFGLLFTKRYYEPSHLLNLRFNNIREARDYINRNSFFSYKFSGKKDEVIVSAANCFWAFNTARIIKKHFLSPCKLEEVEEDVQIDLSTDERVSRNTF